MQYVCKCGVANVPGEGIKFPELDYHDAPAGVVCLEVGKVRYGIPLVWYGLTPLSVTLNTQLKYRLQYKFKLIFNA